MIKISNLSKSFGGVKCLDSINLEMGADERVIIMGQNGAGKTTLVRSILGEYIPNAGSVKIAGVDVLKDRESALSHIGFVPQLPPPINLSVADLLSYAQTCGANKKEVFEIAESMDLDVSANLKKVFSRLSGGMKQKLLIAIAMARDPQVYIFDEPTANLDVKGRERFYDLVSKKMEKRLMIFISHRIEEVGDILNRKVEMEFGKIILDEKITQKTQKRRVK